ncbi:MAG: MFS transporter [Eubacterium sp.]
MNTNSSKTSSLGIVAIMSIFFLSMGVGTITPALNSIMEAFPDLSVSTIYLSSTLPSLTIIPTTIIAGMLAGNKAKYKTLASIGIVIFVLGGVAPFFTNDFTAILIERAVFGIGLGILAPLGNALILGNFEGDRRASLMGTGTLMANVGGVILQFLGGYFAGIQWNYCFLPHVLGIASLILVILFLPEPALIEQKAKDADKPKAKIPVGVWITSVLFGSAMFVSYPMLMGMSTYIAQLNIGNAATSAIVLSFFTVGGMVAGVIFGKVFKLTGRFVFAIGLFLMAVGYAMLLFVPNVIMIIIGAAVVGVGFSTLMPAVMMLLGMICPPEVVAISTSILLAIMNLFAFISTYWIQMIANITGDPIVMPMYVGMGIAAIGGIIFLFVNPFPKEKE